jgi:hypothetical protein
MPFDEGPQNRFRFVRDIHVIRLEPGMAFTGRLCGIGLPIAQKVLPNNYQSHRRKFRPA